MLAGGDRRSIGRSQEAVRLAAKDPGLVPVLVRGLDLGDPIVRMRAADALEKVTAGQPALLGRHRRRLLTLACKERQPEVRWHLAQMLPRLRLAAADRAVAVRILTGYLGDRSRIVRACALEALGELARTDRLLRRQVLPLVEESVASGSPAVRARGRQVLKRLVV